MSIFSKLYRAETTFDFVGGRRRWFALSAVLIAISLLSFLVRGLNLSIDFEGGVSVQTRNEAQASIADVRDVLASIGQDTARVEELNNGQSLRVRTAALDIEDENALVRAVADVAGVEVEDTSVDAVGPTFGDEITRRAIRALVVFLAVVAIFISWRFEWKMAMAGLAALAHDLVITFGVYSVTGFEVTPATVIAVLTILGYSLYDTVVVFDKVNEDVDAWSDSHTYSEIVNRAMNEVLMRSINTSLTSLLPVGSLLFVGSFLLGASTLREFALALFVGIAAGTYSSIFFASPLLAVWKEREEYWSRLRKRLEARREPKVVSSDTASQPAGPRPSRPATSTGAVPRPPKKGRKR